MTDAMRANKVADDDPVGADQIASALTAGRLVYEDGATQVFEPHGATIYIEGGRRTDGEWYVDDDGRFCSFWPPTYRACYDLRWIVEGGTVVGLRFTELQKGLRLDGRYH